MRTLSSLRVLALLVVALLVGATATPAAAAPPVTTLQWDAFRAAVKAQPQGSAIATAYANKETDTLVALYNANSATNLWRSDIKPAELATAIVMSEYITLTAVQQGGMLLLLQLGAGALDATSSTVRASFSTLFTGKTTLTNLTAMAQRKATVFEAIAAYLTVAAPANVCAPEIYGHVLTRFEVGSQLWDAQGNPL